MFIENNETSSISILVNNSYGRVKKLWITV